ncbi:TPA: transposase [Escherichia coli]|nr:transposase [Escherichia coli]
MGTKVSDMQKNVTPGRRKGCPNYPPEFKQQLVAASCEPGISISKLALENGINANLLFKWRQQWREGKLLLPSSESPQLLPVTLDAAAEQPESLAEDPETLSISCEVTFRHGTLRFNGNVSEKLLTLLIRKRLVRTVLIFTESSDQLSRATDRVPGLPASPGYVQ